MKHPKIKAILINSKQIKKGIKAMAAWVNANYQDHHPILLGILKGCIPLFGQLISQIKIDCQTDFMSVTSFHGGVEASTEPLVNLEPTIDVKNRHVLIVEDIVDTARTLTKVRAMLEARGAKSVKIITLLDKIEGRKVHLVPSYSAFDVPNKFLVGFGLDYEEDFRNLPYVGILKPEFIKK